MPLRATLLANAINLALDPLLIFKFGLGVKGAAYATVIGEVCTVLDRFSTLLGSYTSCFPFLHSSADVLP